MLSRLCPLKGVLARELVQRLCNGGKVLDVFAIIIDCAKERAEFSNRRWCRKAGEVGDAVVDRFDAAAAHRVAKELDLVSKENGLVRVDVELVLAAEVEEKAQMFFVFRLSLMMTMSSAYEHMAPLSMSGLKHLLMMRVNVAELAFWPIGITVRRKFPTGVEKAKSCSVSGVTRI